MRSVAAVAVVLAAAGPAAAAPRVVSQITATGDVHDVAAVDGGLAFATSGGLVLRRAGERRTLTAVDGLPGVRLRSVSAIGDQLWVGGIDGAARLARGADGRYAVAQTLAVRRVQRAVEWRGSIWLASFGGGLHRVPADKLDAKPARVKLGRFRDRLTDLAVVGDRLWVATAGAGVLVINRRGAVERMIGRRHGLASTLVWDLAAAGDGGVLIATAAGIARADAAGEIDKRAAIARASRRLPIRDVRAVLASGDRVWAATAGAGLWRIDGAHRRRIAGPSSIRALAARGDDVVLATERGARTAAGGSLIDGGLPSPDVTALARAFGKVWIGTFDQGLATLDPAGRIRAERRATDRFGLDRRINDLAVAGGRLWIATDRGLWWHDGKQFSHEIAPHAPGRVHVTSLHVDASGALWATSARTVARRDFCIASPGPAGPSRRCRDGRWTEWTGDDQLPMLQAHAVTTDAGGRVWVGTLSGLLRLDPATGKLEHHGVATAELPVDWVTALVPFDGGVVAGTYHGGLSWERDGRFRVEPEASRGKPGVPAGWVNPHAMAVVDGALWIGTLDRGLVIGKTGMWTRLRIADGLPSDDVTAVLADGADHMWVGTRGGLVRLKK